MNKLLLIILLLNLCDVFALGRHEEENQMIKESSTTNIQKIKSKIKSKINTNDITKGYNSVMMDENRENNVRVDTTFNEKQEYNEKEILIPIAEFKTKEDSSFLQKAYRLFFRNTIDNELNFNEELHNLQDTPTPQMTAFLASFLGGWFGLDWFILSKGNSWYILAGVFKLLTLGGCGLWYIVDWIRVLTNGFPDGNGQPLKSW